MVTMTAEQEYEVNRKKSMIGLLWVGIISIVMLFAGLTSAYIVREAEGNWLVFKMPMLFWVSTAIILVSSITMSMAQNAIKKGNLSGLKTLTAITLLLGIAFAVCQFMGWSDLVESKVFFTGSQSNASGSFFYVITGLHLAHLAGGLIALIVVLVKAGNKAYSADNYTGVTMAGTYWHFLDILWIYLFLFLLFIR
jgi:cytochrome c oxidase subunit 3